MRRDRHGLWPPAICDLPVTNHRTHDRARILARLLDVPRHAQGCSGRGGPYPGRSPGAWDRPRRRRAAAEGRICEPADLSGRRGGQNEISTMKITDVTLTLFTWDGIPPVIYGPNIRMPGGSSTLGLLAIVTDAGITGQAFFGGANRGAETEGRSLIDAFKPLLMGQDPLHR